MGICMKRAARLLILSVLLSWGNSAWGADLFYEAGVIKQNPPISAPEFNLKNLGGGEVSLKEYRGRYVFIHFFLPGCDVCMKESSSFDKLSRQMKSENIVFLLIGETASNEELMSFKEMLNISVAILKDETGAVGKNYKIFGHHEAFLINPDGKIIGRGFGGMNWTSPQMRALIQDLLSAKK